MHPALAGNPVVLERFLRFGLNKFTDSKVADEIQEFFKTKDTRGYNKGLEVVDDTIRSYAAYAERDAGVVREWLKANGYA